MYLSGRHSGIYSRLYSGTSNIPVLFQSNYTQTQNTIQKTIKAKSSKSAIPFYSGIFWPEYPLAKTLRCLVHGSLFNIVFGGLNFALYSALRIAKKKQPALRFNSRVSFVSKQIKVVAAIYLLTSTFSMATNPI